MFGTTTKEKMFLSALLGVTLLIAASQRMEALNGKAPVIRQMTPNVGAAGYGQLVTVQGANLYKRLNPLLTQVTCVQGSMSGTAFVFPSPSKENEIFIRLPFTLTPGLAAVTVTTLDDNLVSNVVMFRVRSRPGTPIPRRLVALGGAFPTITSAARGMLIGISAYGTDTVGVTVIFIQEAREISVRVRNSWSGSGIGIVSEVKVPAKLEPGPVSVRLQVTVNGVTSERSLPLSLTVTH
jgi:hypothetical protein